MGIFIIYLFIFIFFRMFSFEFLSPDIGGQLFADGSFLDTL